MKTLWAILILLMVANTWAAAPVITAGKYSCTIQKTSDLFLPRPYTLEFSQTGPQPKKDRSVILTQDDGKVMAATYFEASDIFKVNKNTMVPIDPNLNRNPYMVFSFNFKYGYENENAQHFVWLVKIQEQIQGGVSEKNYPFDCTLVSGLKVADTTIKRYNIICQTTEQFDKPGKTYRIKLSFQKILSTAELEMLSAGKDEDMPILVYPQNNYLESLNDNWSLREKDNGNIKVSGDADGFFLIDLELDQKTNFTTGTVKVRNNQDESFNPQSKLACKVKSRIVR
jgi:hypothetical protein